MKLALFFLFAFAAAQSFGQKTNADTSLHVFYAFKHKVERELAVFINGKHVISQNIFATINPNNIENIEVIRRDTSIKHISFGGQIYMKTKSSYTPKLISLSDLRSKYTNFKEEQVVFVLDGNFVTANYEDYLVDEGNLLTIVVDKLEKGVDKTEIGLIKLLTKTTENIKSRNNILLRGKELSIR